MFDLFQLRCFLAVADELHFGRAAERLHMTQPPLSRQIQLLEHAVGARLLERTSRSVRLTVAGQGLYQDAQQLLRLAERAADTARRTEKGQMGRVIVGYTAVTGYALMPELVASASKALPDIEIVLQEMVTSGQLQALQDRRIDIGFVRPVSGPVPLNYRQVASEPMRLAIPSRHPLARKRTIRLEDMHGVPLVMFSRTEGRYFHDMIVNLFAATGVQPRFIHDIAQTHTIMALVRKGLGLAIVPDSVRHLHLNSVAIRPLWRDDAVAQTYLTWRPDENNPALPPVRDFFVRELDRAARGV